MKKKVTLLMIIFFISLQAFLLIQIYSLQDNQPLDTVLINDIKQSALQQWQTLSMTQSFNNPDQDHTLDFTIINKQEEILYTTNAEFFISSQHSLTQRETIINIQNQDQYLGQLIIHNPINSQSLINQQKTSWIISIMTILEIILVLGYFRYLQYIIFQPFQKLKEFASRVAHGDLDFPLTMDRQNIFGAFSESFDLMREELKIARLHEQQANQSKKELVAKLSHDIKTPVASIQAVSELMSVTSTSSKEKQQLQIIHDKANQINQLISDLFHASLEELQELKVTPTLHQSQEIYQIIKNSDYQNMTHIQSIPECLISYDAIRLQQVFDNLLSNSYKYEASQIDISFEFKKNHFVIFISDNGLGIKKDELPLLFEKFYRGSNSQKKSGSGLGLYISHYFMKQMHGDMKAVESMHGLSLVLSLPLAS